MELVHCRVPREILASCSFMRPTIIPLIWSVGRLLFYRIVMPHRSNVLSTYLAVALRAANTTISDLLACRQFRRGAGTAHDSQTDG